MATIGVLSLLVLGLGFAVQVVLAAALGAGSQMDMFLVAIALPALITNVALSALSLSLVPIFREAIMLGSSGSAWVLARRLIIKMSPFFVFMVVILVIAAEPIVRILAPGFDAATVKTITALLRMMSLAALIDLYRALLGSFYYAQDRFFLPQVAPIFNHVAMIVSALVLLERWGLEGLAIGWLAGSVLMILVLALGLLRSKGPTDEKVEVGTGLAGLAASLWPAVVIALVNQVIPVIDRAVATTLPQGSVSYLGYGIKLLEISLRTAPMAVVLAAFPRMSGLFSAGDRDGLQREVTSTVRWILLAMVPLAVLITSLKLPLVRMLFERGAFDQGASEGVATAVGWYGLALVPASIVYLVIHVMFAVGRPRPIAMIGAASVIATIGLDYLFSRAWGFRGIAVVYVLVASLWALGGAQILARSKERITFFPGTAWVGKIALAAAVSLVAVMATTAFLYPRELGRLRDEVVVAVGTISGAISYSGVLWLSDLPELVLIRARLRSAVTEWTSRASA